MIFKTIAAVLVCVLLHTSVAAEEQLSQTQTVDKMQQVLHKAQDKDKAVKITLRKKMDNQRKFMGKVKEITDAGFSIAQQKHWENDELCIPRRSAGWSSWSLKRRSSRSWL